MRLKQNNAILYYSDQFMQKKGILLVFVYVNGHLKHQRQIE